MEIDFALIADGAMIRPEGKLDLIGAGFDTIVSTAVPARHPRFVLSVRLLLTPEEAENEHEIAASLRSANGELVTRAGGPVPSLPPEVLAELPAGAAAGVAIGLMFENTVFPAFGHYMLSLSWQGHEVWSRPIRVVEQPRPA